MKEKLEKELRIKLMTDHFKNIELKDKQKNLNINLIKFDDTYQVEISKKIKIRKEEFSNIQREIKKIYQSMENSPDHWDNSNVDYPDLKKIWEFSYEDNEIIYKKEGTITYPENWLPFIDYITQKYI